MTQTRTMTTLEASNDLLFCLNLALIVRLVNVQTSLSSLEPNVTFWINSALGLTPQAYLGSYTAFFLIAAGLAFIMYAILRLLISYVSVVFRFSYGFVALIALPLIWLAHATIHEVLPGLPNPPHGWLLVELSAALVCSILFFCGQWPLPSWAGFILIATHFVLWGWLFMGGLYFWLAPVKLLFPLVGFLSCITWSVYVLRRQREPHDAEKTQTNPGRAGSVPK